jgi:uncharacterized protein
MKTRTALAFTLCFLFLASIALAADYPKAVGFVNDFANLLPKEAAEKLNSDLINFEKKTTVEIVVVTVPWLHGTDIETYTKGLATNWGVGKAGKNNGVVFLIAPKERKLRIQTASGIRSVLTDSKAENIRDRIILPRFKTDNMAQGIIEGTQAIMKAIDTEPAKEQPPAKPLASSPEDPYLAMKIIVIIVAIAVAIAFCIIAIILPIKMSRARKDVLFSQNKFREAMTKAENIAKNPDVNKDTRNKLGSIKNEYAPIDFLLPRTPGIKWTSVREKLNSLAEQLDYLTRDMNREIAFADQARQKGPELMEKIPKIIAATEKKLAEGKPSKEAIKHLEEARNQYIRAQSMHANGSSLINWVVLYMLLTSINSNCERAQENHSWANGESTSRHSTSSESMSPPSFGGGGGFETGGGGATGSW